jgi:hypothetical protein
MKWGVAMRTDIPLSSIADLAKSAETAGWESIGGCGIREDCVCSNKASMAHGNGDI